MDTKPEIHLYLDDSGSRDPDKKPRLNRDDKLDYFAFGGIMIKSEDTNAFLTAHREFCHKHKIDYPLHSWAIRGGRENFGWLKNPEKAFAFYSDLEKFLIALPVVGIAAVIDRPGYMARYKDKYQDRLWLMCKTAFCILIERAAKYADTNGRTLRVFFERAGKAEDRDLVRYMKDLKKDGAPFDGANSALYSSLSAEDFRRIVMGEPKRRTKSTPMIQIADLVLYPMAKGGYDPAYRAYVSLMEAGRLIDALLEPDARACLGIKYSCFPKPNEKGPA